MGWKRNKSRTWKIAQSEQEKERSKKSKIAGFFRKLIPCCPRKDAVEDELDTDSYSISQDVQSEPQTHCSTLKTPSIHSETSGTDVPTKTTRRSRKNKKSGSYNSKSDGRRSGAERDTVCQDTPDETKTPTVHTLESNVSSKIAPRAQKNNGSGSRITDSKEKISEAKGDTAIQGTPAESEAPTVDRVAFERNMPSTTELRTRKGRKSGSNIHRTADDESSTARQEASAGPYTFDSTSRTQNFRRDSLGSDTLSKTTQRAQKKKKSASRKSTEKRMGVTGNTDCQEAEPCTYGAAQEVLSSRAAASGLDKIPKNGKSGLDIATSEWEMSGVSRDDVQAKHGAYGSERDQDALGSNTPYEAASRAARYSKSAYLTSRTGEVESSASKDTARHDVSYPPPISTTTPHYIHHDTASSEVFVENPVRVHPESRPDVSKSFHGDISARLIRSGEPSVIGRGSVESTITSAITSPLQDARRSEPLISSHAPSFQRSTFEPPVCSDSGLPSSRQYNQGHASTNSEQRNRSPLQRSSPSNPSDREAAIVSLARLYNEIKESIEEEDILAGKRFSDEGTSPVPRDITSGSPDARPTTSTIAHRGSLSGSYNSSGLLPHDRNSQCSPHMSAGISPSIQRDTPSRPGSGPFSPVGGNLSSWAPPISPETMSPIQHNQSYETTSPTGPYIPSWANQSLARRDSPMRPTSKNLSITNRCPSSWANISPDVSSKRNARTGFQVSPDSVSPGHGYLPSWVHNSEFQSSHSGVISGKNASRVDRLTSPTDKRNSTLPSLESAVSQGDENVTSRAKCIANLSSQLTPISSLTKTSLPTRTPQSAAQRATGFPSREEAAVLDDGTFSPSHKNMSPLAPGRMYDNDNLSLCRPKTASTNMVYSRYGRHIQQQTKPGCISITDYSARLPPPDGLTTIMSTAQDQSLRSQVRKTAQSYLKPLSSMQGSQRPRRVDLSEQLDITSGKRKTESISTVVVGDGASSGTSSSGTSSETSSPTKLPRRTPSSKATALPKPSAKTDSQKARLEVVTSPKAPSRTSCAPAEDERVDIKHDQEDQFEKEKRLRKELEDHVNFPPIEASSENLRGWCLPKSLHQYVIEPFPPRRLSPHYPIMSCGTNHVNVGISFFEDGFEDGSQFKGKECTKSIEDMIRFAIKNGNTAHLEHLHHHQQINATHALKIMQEYELPGELKWDLDDILASCREAGIDLPEEELPTGLAMEIVKPSSEGSALCNHVAALDADKSEALLYTFERQFMVFLPTRDGRVLLVDVHPHATLKAGAVILVAPKTTEQIQVMLDGYHKEHLKSPKFNLGQGTKFTYKMPPETSQ